MANKNGNNKLKVLTWNVGIGRDGDSWEKGKVMGLLQCEAETPPYDIIFLQEVPVWGLPGQIKVTDFEEETLTQRYHVLKSHEIVGEKKSIYIFITLIRKGFVENEYFQIAEVRLGGPIGSYFPCALVATSENQPAFAFVNVHLKSGDGNHVHIRENQANAIGTYAKHFGQIILGGDFNCDLIEANNLDTRMIDDHCNVTDNPMRKGMQKKTTTNENFPYSYGHHASCPDHIFCHPHPGVGMNHNLSTVESVRGNNSTCRGQNDDHFHFPVETTVCYH